MSYKRGTIQKRTQLPTQNPTMVDLAWAAGFLEGEGSFTRTTATAHGNGSERIQCRQMDRGPLDRLSALFGGRIGVIRPSYNSLIKNPHLPLAIWDWTLQNEV